MLYYDPDVHVLLWSMLLYMENNLLLAKLRMPLPRTSFVARPRLLARLDELPQGGAWQHKLTLVSAPAGYGKTTLLCQWLSGVDCPVAWVSLDENDNDPRRFLTYLTTAFQRIAPDLGAGIQDSLQSASTTSPAAPPVEMALTNLLNDLESLGNPMVLVLDDYHQIDSVRVHGAVSFLLDNQPRQLHLAIASRADPPLPIARLRAQDQLAEVHAADLSFAPDEAAAFLNDAMSLDLPAKHVTALVGRTEGWIAGLQLAALALQGTRREIEAKQPPRPRVEEDGATAFIQAFTGSHRFVLDYLAEEVLNQQSAEIRAFLLETAVLDRLSASLCNALTGRDDSQQILERLDAANLFIIPQDDECRWYRYHHLFADLLRQRLQRERQELVPELHTRVSAWYEENQFLQDAVKHALLAEDFERAARLIKQNGRGMLMRGEMNTLLPWLDALPPELVSIEPALALFRAWALAFTGQWEMVEDALTTVDEDAVPGQVAAVRTYVAGVKEVGKVHELAAEAIAQLPEDDHFHRALVNFFVGIAYFSSGRPAAASQALDEVIQLSHSAGHPYLLMTATGHLGYVQEMHGLLHEALATHREALRLVPGSGERPAPFNGIAYVGIAELLYEWNELDGALRYATEGIRLTNLGGFVGFMLGGHACTIRVNAARGETAAAWERLQEAERMAAARGYVYLQGVFADLRARLCITEGQLTEAARWLRGRRLQVGDRVNRAREVEHMAVARVLLAQTAVRGATEADGEAGAYDEALELLARLLQAAEEAERMGSVIKILALQAVGLDACGKSEGALRTLARALSLAEPEGYVRTFLDEGRPMAELLRRAVTAGNVAGYAATLLAAFDEEVVLATTATTTLVEPLSERELEVLRLIIAGLSNREIAEELVIALSTVKSHINNIYGKLNVKRRTQAVARAQELGLL